MVSFEILKQIKNIICQICQLNCIINVFALSQQRKKLLKTNGFKPEGENQYETLKCQMATNYLINDCYHFKITSHKILLLSERRYYYIEVMNGELRQLCEGKNYETRELRLALKRNDQQTQWQLIRNVLMTQNSLIRNIPVTNQKSKRHEKVIMRKKSRTKRQGCVHISSLSALPALWGSSKNGFSEEDISSHMVRNPIEFCIRRKDNSSAVEIFARNKIILKIINE